MTDRNHGFTLMEMLVCIAVLGILATLAIAHPGRHHESLVLDTAMRHLRLGLDRGRLAAERSQQPCALSLTAQGWQAPQSSRLPHCHGANINWQDVDDQPLTLHSNLPELVRFTSNGLILDGGLVVLSHPQLTQRLCLVIGLPLGITRTGNYDADPDQPLRSSHCQPTHAD